MPRLEDLELLLDVTEFGSLGRAAQAQHISQPAASARISRLERNLRVQLLERLPSGSKLTTEGAVVANWARNIVEAVERLVSSASALAANQELRLRVASSRTIAEYLLPAWLTAFHDAAEALTITLTVGNSEDCLDKLRAGDADVALVGLEPEPPIESTVIGHSELVMVVAPGHSWTKQREPIAAEQLAGIRVFVRERGTGTRAALDALLRRRNLEMPQLIEIDAPAAIKAAAMTSDSPAIISRVGVERELANGSLVQIPIEGDDYLMRPLYAAWLGTTNASWRRQLIEVISRSPFGISAKL